MVPLDPGFTSRFKKKPIPLPTIYGMARKQIWGYYSMLSSNVCDSKEKIFLGKGNKRTNLLEA